MSERTGRAVDAETPAGSPSEGSADACEHAHHGYMGDKDAYLRRMRRIEGQARGITRMIDEEQYCIDILTQVTALTRALQTVATGLVEDHLRHCVMDAARSGNDGEAAAKLAEATAAINRLVRS
ncbi:DNA-binding transcriptional regulator, FrmR family [Kytococcus aerolatus]|uniref:DNA-binding transcriptional regulator, FrmR family n=1 Tax=Kytococcus aerolatus TaxID=592308 RepID=A0A212U581_9MICO|nr:DNA-binding transcriptional regulator, FrmR family [Kytococcus aerolatus]